MNKDSRICVIGAGAAGLAAAHFLTKRGYQNVTVLERSNRIGGKCWTVEHKGRTYELGAGIVTAAYRTVSEIMRDVGTHSKHVFSSMDVDFEKHTCTKRRFFFHPPKPLAFTRAMLRLARVLNKNQRIFRPGFDGIHPDLCLPFSEWAKKQHVQPIADLITAVLTGFGYGYYNEVPAAYVLKYMTIMLPPQELLDEGYQGLWNRVGNRLDVRLGTVVTSIERNGEVKVTTTKGTEQYDYLVLACPLDDALDFIDASAEEKNLFSKIRYYDFHIYAGFSQNLPQVRYAMIPRSRPHRTMFWYRRWLDSPLCTFYGLGRSSKGMKNPVDHDEIRHNIEEDISCLGGHITEYKLDHTWKYFPHVSSEDMVDGYYERVEALQGGNRTFYTGELFNFSTVEMVSTYSKRLVTDFF